MKHEIKTLADLAELDNGIVGLLFKAALKQALLDINERPNTKKTREVSVILQMLPETDEGMLCGVFTEVIVNTKVPKSRTRTINMGKRGVDTLVYDDLSADNHRQGTLPMNEESEEQ